MIGPPKRNTIVPNCSAARLVLLSRLARQGTHACSADKAQRFAEASYVISRRGCEFIQSRHQPDAPARDNSSNGFSNKGMRREIDAAVVPRWRFGLVLFGDVVAGIDATSILARRRLLERVNEMRRRNGSLVAAGTTGSPVLKHGPSPPAAEKGVNALGE